MYKPIRFSASGPEGWLEAPPVALETAKLIEGQPMGGDYIYFRSDKPRARTGIWRSSPYTEWYDSYPADEFMYILEGQVILEGEGFREEFKAGNAFLLPRGYRGYWRQPVAMLKYYVIIE